MSIILLFQFVRDYSSPRGNASGRTTNYSYSSSKRLVHRSNNLILPITHSTRSTTTSPRLQKGDSSPPASFKTSTLEALYLDIDVTALGTWLGCKGYKGVLHTGEPVFAKLWDGWKHSSEEADRESAIYNSIAHQSAIR